MDRVKLAEKLKETEEGIKSIEDNLAAIRSHYFKWGRLSLEIETADYVHTGTEDYISFNTELMEAYLVKEKERLQEKSSDIIKEMTQ
ncbi:hypothetical protein Bp8pC_169 [Bacillus phage Bp8p-C]|uniref:Uncharacterized protein n=2 Tax=Agatevirus Bp8pC TaxID=1910937 RepID=A0A0A0PQS9_9CAUD|nr:hypothetical protein AXJ20_gp179 [Bacillus phage Bp8p-C]YP_009784469.1 hypothetical protein QLX39_gp179 [Bacillus phage Bp8p-T]AHJ87599.1 hypothetical protein Bp8pC_169 [Bacillus phage Bp8p-C]AHJ87810.1 hypothetical protein Bp8pT_169 [Bacillus phage Bp8p-T]